MAAAFLVLLFLAWLTWCLRAAARSRATGVIGSTSSFKRGLELIGPAHHSDFVRTYGRLAPVDATPSAKSLRGAEGSPAPVVGTPKSPAALKPPPVLKPRPEPKRRSGRTSRPEPQRRSSPTSRPASQPLRLRLVPLAVFVGLALAAMVTLGAALFAGTWELHLAFDAALALFVAWLFEDEHRRALERRLKVTPLPKRRADFSDLRPAAGDR